RTIHGSSLEMLSTTYSVVARYLFFSSIRQTPRSTLFPYTTLFRSCTEAKEMRCASCSFTVSMSLVMNSRARSAAAASSSPEESRDRKSTRLNSSHVSISYAVFCLKKKNNKKQLLLDYVHIVDA